MDITNNCDKIKDPQSLDECHSHSNSHSHCSREKAENAEKDYNWHSSMGKCVSKQPSPSAFAIESSDSVEYLSDTTATGKDIHNKLANSAVHVQLRNAVVRQHSVFIDDGDNGPTSTYSEGTSNGKTDVNVDPNNANFRQVPNEGQSESKKASKKSGLETKGTAMSFGFRKKILTTPIKKKKSKGIDVDNSTETCEFVVGPTAVDNSGEVRDKNGNTGSSTEMLSKEGETQALSQSGAAARNTRFGFRAANTVRPASTGITPKIADFHDYAENNNNGMSAASVAKRRSKSAHTSRTLTSNRTANDQQWDPKINQSAIKNSNHNSNEYQRRQLSQHVAIGPPQYTHSVSRHSGLSQQYNVISSGMHTNVIVKPTPKPPAPIYSKFTLHTASLPKPQYPVPVSLSSAGHAPMDSKSAKQMANNNRKGFAAPRDVSVDSGICSLDATFDAGSANGAVGGRSPKRSKSRPRNLQMVMNGRHKFEVRDLMDESLSSDSQIEPLALPKLPSAFSSTNQTIPLSGLVRSNTILEREPVATGIESGDNLINRPKLNRNISDVENVEEEKLFLDRSTSEKSSKIQSIKEFVNASKNSSPASSRTSWSNNAGESLALKDFSSSDESRDNRDENMAPVKEEEDFCMTENHSGFSSLNLSPPQERLERPKTLTNITETKFAEMAASVTDFLLDDETSPTDSLVSSTESDEAVVKKHKKKICDDMPEKDIDEISPELEMCSPISPGTPTHASNSLSLSDGGRDFLIDDEIADQPALLFNDAADAAESLHLGNSMTDTPTLRDTASVQRSTPKAKGVLQAAIELSLRTPVSLRRQVLDRCESFDTLSPCESIASDDLMVDFDMHSSMDSIDRMSASIKSRNGSAATQGIDDTTHILSEFETKGGDMIREWNNVLRVHRTEKDSIISHLPARATRLLNRSRLQQCQLSNNGSDSPKSNESFARRTPSRTSSIHHSHRDVTSSSDDLLLYDKSFRNSMIQDVLHFKKQLIRLRRILQEDEECLMKSETLNPFDANNGHLFASCGLDSKLFLDDLDKDLGSLTSSTTTEEPIQELADLRRQVVYLQGQVDDRDRTIRLQRNLIEKLESEVDKTQSVSVATSVSGAKECVNSATQTDRIRPLSIGPDGLSRSKPEYTSYITHFPAITTDTTVIHSPTQNTNHHTRRHTIISTTFTNYNQVSQSPSRRASIGFTDSSTNGYKPVKITLIGDPFAKVNNNDSTENRNIANGLTVNDQNRINNFQNGKRYQSVDIGDVSGKCQPLRSLSNAENDKPSVTIV